MEAIMRRFLYILFSMYFDDATMQDWEKQGQAGQAAVHEVANLFGSPFAPAKCQCMGNAADFLGLEHDTSAAATSGHITFWVRERLEHKLRHG